MVQKLLPVAYVKQILRYSEHHHILPKKFILFSDY